MLDLIAESLAWVKDFLVAHTPIVLFTVVAIVVVNLVIRGRRASVGRVASPSTTAVHQVHHLHDSPFR